MVDHPYRHQIHLSRLSQKPGPPQILLAVMASQICFFTQYLTVEQPYGGNHVEQKYPVGEY
jgi:hypothetical protein